MIKAMFINESVPLVRCRVMVPHAQWHTHDSLDPKLVGTTIARTVLSALADSSIVAEGLKR